MRTAIVLPDTHLESDRISNEYKLVKRFARLREWTYVITLGDFLGLECINPYSRYKLGATEGKRLKKDCEAAQREFDFWLKHCKELHFIMGNHEDWIYQFCERNPNAAMGVLEPEHLLFSRHPEIIVYPINELLSIGELSFSHGMYWNLHHSKKHCLEIGTNLIYGHTHGRQMHTHHFATGKFIKCESIGCLCDLAPSWQKGRNNHWVNAFALVEWNNQGDFSYQVIEIIDGRFVYNGKTWRV